MDTKSYFKNLTRSINYAVDDLLKVKYPSTYNLKNIKKAISEGNAEYRQARDAARRAEATNILRPATIPFDKDTALMNLKLDLKSGNFYNKNRIKAYEDKAMENAFNMTLNQSMDNVSNSFGVLANSINRQNKLTVQVANSQMQNANRTAMFQDQLSKKRHSDSLFLNKVINDNIVNIANFNNNKLAPFLDQSLNYYRDSMIELRKQNMTLIELKDNYKTVNYNTLNPKSIGMGQTNMEKAFGGGFNA